MALAAIKYRAYPTPEQAEFFQRTFGCVRKIWNCLLADSNEYHKLNKKHHVNYESQYKSVYPYLKDVDSLALSNARLQLQTAYNRFFEKKSGFPKFKSKHKSKEYNLSPLGAYNYLVYLIEDPERALADLKAGLPTKDSSRFEKFIDQEEVQGKMDEKITTPVEEIAEPQKTPAETPAEQTALLEKLDAVQQALAALQQTFNDKIAEDTHKNSLFDNMHRELVRYQNGALDKIVDTIALDIIQLVDTTKGHVRVYDKKEPTEENYKKLLRIVKGIAEDLEDILYRQNIESYRVPGHEVDTRHQKIIQTVPTDDKSKDNLIAVRAADGYEKGDKVLRPERIKIFKYEAPATKPTENN